MPISWLTGVTALAEPEEVDGSSRESFSEDGVSCSVDLRCPWSERHDLLTNILGNQLLWPYFSSVPCRAASASAMPMPGGVGTQDGAGYAYETALISLTFEIRDIEEGENTNIYSESLEPTAEFLTLPHDDFRWGSSEGDEIKSAEAPGRLELGFDYVVSLYGLSSIPGAVLSLPGKCNNGSVTSPSLGMTFGDETLLYNPPTISRTVTTEGDSKYTMQTRLTYRPSGWNKFWRPKTASYEAMFHKDGSGAYKNFPPASFSGVLP